MTTTKAPPRLVALARDLQRAKRDEDAAKKRRVDAERAILALVDFTKPEGQETYEAETPGGSTAKVQIKQPISTSFDGDQWPKVRGDVSVQARKVVRTTYVLDTKAAKALQDDESQKTSWLKIAALLTRKPGKIAVDLKDVLVEEDDELEGLSEEMPIPDAPDGDPGLEGVDA